MHSSKWHISVGLRLLIQYFRTSVHSDIQEVLICDRPTNKVLATNVRSERAMQESSGHSPASHSAQEFVLLLFCSSLETVNPYKAKISKQAYFNGLQLLIWS